MDIKKNFSVICLILLMIFLTSCHKNSKYYLERFPPQPIDKSVNLNIEDVNLTIHQLSNVESKEYFKVDLLAKNVIPIHLKIFNASNNIYTIRPSYIDLIPAQPAIISKLLHWDTSWFVSTLGYISFMFWWPGLFIVGQTGYDMYKNNREIDKLICQNAVYGQVIDILPFEVIEKFIFVQNEDYKQNFKIRMFNQREQKLITFDVILP